MPMWDFSYLLTAASMRRIIIVVHHHHPPLLDLHHPSIVCSETEKQRSEIRFPTSSDSVQTKALLLLEILLAALH